MRRTDQLARRMGEACRSRRVRQASRLITRLYDAAVQPLGIQISQLHVLINAAGFADGAPLSRLAESLAMDRTTLTRNLAPLVKGGYLRVARDPSDGRTRRVLLAAAGEALLREAYPLWKNAQRELRRRLGRGGFGRLQRELGEVVERLS